jgi:hypothetical protein
VEQPTGVRIAEVALEIVRELCALLRFAVVFMFQLVGTIALALVFVLWLAWGDDDFLTGLFGPAECRAVKLQMLEAAQRTTPCRSVAVPDGRPDAFPLHPLDQ